MSVDLDLLHKLLIENAEIGMPLRDLAFALGVRETEVEVVLINEASSGHIKNDNGRYFTLKRHFPKNVVLRTEDDCTISLHHLLQSVKSGLLLDEIQERLPFDAERIKDRLFAEKTVERIKFIDADSLAYVSTLEFPVENLVNKTYPIQVKGRSDLPKWGLLAGLAGLLAKLIFF